MSRCIHEGANDNVLQALGKFNDRLSQDGAVVGEDTYVISGQRSQLLSRRACETLNLVKLVAIDSVETAKIRTQNYLAKDQAVWMQLIRDIDPSTCGGKCRR